MANWRDNSNVPVFLSIKTSSAFDGATTDAHGDIDGTGNPYTLYTVTGVVLVHHIYAVVTTACASTSDTGTLEVGVTGNTAKLIAQTTVGSGTFAQHDIWTDTGVEPAAEILTNAAPFILSNGNDIIETAATNNITSGALVYYCTWSPQSVGSSIVAA